MEQPEKNEEETFSSVSNMFEEFEKRDLQWKVKHPFRGYIRDWLDKRFPSGIAGYRAYYSLLRPWKILRHIQYKVKYAWQRVFRGWDDSAWWGMDYYLADLIPKLVKELKEHGNGLPMFAFEGMETDEDDNYTEEQMEIATKRWHDVLDEIAEGFESWKNFDERAVAPQDYKYDEDYRKFLKGMYLLIKHWGSFWD